MKISEEIKKLDTTSYKDQSAIWEELKSRFNRKTLIYELVKHYYEFKKWQGRCFILYYGTVVARESPEAIKIAIRALSDKASLVRYRACGLLAYSLDKTILPYLQEVAENSDEKTKSHAFAAIDAINNQNHNFFIDRNHSGSIWEVN